MEDGDIAVQASANCISFPEASCDQGFMLSKMPFFPGRRRKRVKWAWVVGEKNVLTALKSHESKRCAEFIFTDPERHLTLQVLNVSLTRPDLWKQSSAIEMC